jgi:hypothetical protein
VRPDWAKGSKVPKTPDVPRWSKDVQDKMLKFKPGGPSVEEARQAMLEGAEAANVFNKGGRVEKVPEFIIAERAKRGVGGNTPVNSPTRQPDVEDVIEAEPVRQAAVPVVQPEPTPVAVAPVPVIERIAVPAEEDKRKRVETKKFVGEIYKDGKEWIAELTYKNGAGTERFTAGSKDDLMIKLLEGKGFGTTKVRETVQRYKLGDIFDGWDIFFNEVKNTYGLTMEEYNKQPENVRQFHQDNIQAAAILEFKALYPEYYAINENFEKIGQYLNSRKVPLTLHNLELAYRDLSEDDLLTSRPVQKEVVVSAPQVQTPQVTVQVAPPQTEDSVVEAPPAPAVVAPVAPVRKRAATTGLVPGSSSAVPSSDTVPAKTEDGTRGVEPSEQELRELRDAATRGDFSGLKRIATANRRYGRY